MDFNIRIRNSVKEGRLQKVRHTDYQLKKDEDKMLNTDARRHYIIQNHGTRRNRLFQTDIIDKNYLIDAQIIHGHHKLGTEFSAPRCAKTRRKRKVMTIAALSSSIKLRQKRLQRFAKQDKTGNKD